jgi:hypothetical protein
MSMTHIFRRIRHCGTVGAALLIAATAVAQEKSVPPVLTSIAAIRGLSPATAAKGLPVRVTGVVTYANPGESDLFIQNDDAWVYVQEDKRYDLPLGSRVEVEGRTSASYNNQIESTSVQVIGRGTLPQPAFLSYNEGIQRTNDCRYVTLEGVVRAASYQTTPGSSLYLLRTEVDGKMVDIVVENYPGFSPDHLLDATVRATGALGGTFDSSYDRIVGLRLNVWSSSTVEVVQPGDAAAAGRYPTALATLLNSNEILKDRHRVFTTGVVTLYVPGEMMVIQDGGASLLVRTRQLDAVKIGQRVEATGFLGIEDGEVGLDPGEFRILKGEQPVTPQSVTFADAMTGRYANRVVTIEGEVISQTREAHMDTLILRSGDQVFEAVYRKAPGAPDPFAEYERGTRIRATGVCLVHLRGFWGAVESFQIHLRSPEDYPRASVLSGVGSAGDFAHRAGVGFGDAAQGAGARADHAVPQRGRSDADGDHGAPGAAAQPYPGADEQLPAAAYPHLGDSGVCGRDVAGEHRLLPRAGEPQAGADDAVAPADRDAGAAGHRGSDAQRRAMRGGGAEPRAGGAIAAEQCVVTADSFQPRRGSGHHDV